ncbi:MAG TPA: DUF4294 domain-containing protein [Flavobacterium sp.]|uniref:DUF4294 domain-containing protein n=1 Tax=unclassified Flavobacterium TaxID=196869 RepID=UPI0025BAF649|nr:MULTISPECIES: DUF4294 domain-containing protein [unclassified Flavobacterium]HRE78839.1 DUF4294 domain-containing protein [Flavobacterium sp.]
MKPNLLFLVFFIVSTVTFGQETKKDSTVIYYLIENDSVLRTSLDLEEVVVTGKKSNKEDEDRKKFLLLQQRVLKVYPYAKAAADNLTKLNQNMGKFKTEREKKKYFKIVENYLENEFEEQLKKLSRKQGQILVKLIHRQTGKTTYTLVKDLKSGWKAFWASNTAKVFDIDLKEEYNPFTVTEDFLIESILIKAFNEGRLQRQPPAKFIDYDDLSAIWKEKVQKAKDKQAEN